MTKEKAYRKINKTPFKYIPIMILVSLSINILSLALPLSMKQIYSNIIVNKSSETLIWLMVVCVVALVLEAFLRKIKASSIKWISAKYEYQLSSYFIQKILNSFLEDTQSYNVNVERFNSISRVTTFFSTSIFQLFIDLPFMILFMYLIYYIGGYLVFVPIALSIIYIIFMIINSNLFSIHREIQIDTNDRLMTQLSETLEKIHLIKAAGLEEFQIAKYKKVLKEVSEAGYRTNKFQMLPETVSSYFSQIILFSILIGGGYLMIEGQITFGDITACTLLGGRAIAPIQSIMSLLLQRKDIKLLKGRLDAIAKQPNQYSDTTPLFPEDIEGTIEIIDLEYIDIKDGSTKTLSYQIASGRLICINPTEFLSYRQIFSKMVGKENIVNGNILIDNLNIKEWNMSSLKGKIEYLSEHVNIFKGSVMENITYFNATKNQDAYDAAAITGLDVLVNQMSEGYETALESQATNYLSSAFIQRLNLTRSLLIRPRVLLLDRIDESMDYETLEIFIWLLKKLKGKLTIVIATENQIIKDMADRTLSSTNQ